MKKFLVIIIIFIGASGYLFFSCNRKEQSPETLIAPALAKQVDSFIFVKNDFLNDLKNNADEKTLQLTFLQLRNEYKKIEWATEYFSPVASRLVNGAPVEEVEPNGAVTAPGGLQVMESFLFPKYDATKKDSLIYQLQQIQFQCDDYKTYFKNIDIAGWQIFDAAKLEVFRIETLGITGFDNPLTLKSMQESATALQSIKNIIGRYLNKNNIGKLDEKFDAAIDCLLQNKDFYTFNRAAFIRLYADSVTIGITHLEKQLHLHPLLYNRLLKQSAQTLFDTDAFDINAYVPNPSSFVTPQKIALGKLLFADKNLSGDGTRSCQSCHQPDKAFADGLVKNTIIGTNKPLPRNTPTLLNSVFQPALFYDLRAITHEEQARDVVENKNEMHGSMRTATEKLNKSKKYKVLFATAYPQHKNDIDSFEVMNAIASYMRSLAALNSRFDKYMRGNSSALNQDEINGFNLFTGKAKCATCHYLPLFNGTVPPRFVKIDAEVIGVPATSAGNTIDTDLGQYSIVHVDALKYAFKTSTVRNAARTAPYMHNGVFATLEQVIDFYDKGGGAGLGFDVENQTLSSDKLNLSQKEKNDLIAFIGSLDSD
ncbi:hypothetical protein A9P82_02155 [Arachidicoccus ginsenosidimutans]|uniref:cytochrome-c peroxidase n=1 Tax=Arachidicoccus sp. BS20 TaxID=1850526 RepID=UPI0007F0F0C8|nr:cytochrome c peroxidase [Arachidicoccus sp. BS20]ANI88216.1 hypothetical protein A9P82_02155 [Arachidicoccus sp. BS20]